MDTSSGTFLWLVGLMMLSLIVALFGPRFASDHNTEERRNEYLWLVAACGLGSLFYAQPIYALLWPFDGVALVVTLLAWGAAVYYIDTWIQRRRRRAREKGQRENERELEQRKQQMLPNYTSYFIRHEINSIADIYGAVLTRDDIATLKQHFIPKESVPADWEPVEHLREQGSIREVGKLPERQRTEVEEYVEQQKQALTEHVDQLLERRLADGVSLGRITYLVDTPYVREQHENAQSSRHAPDKLSVQEHRSLYQPRSLRGRHTYIVGKTGKGKTNLLHHLILQDIAHGRGVGVLSPEAEIFRDKLLPHIPEHRVEDVIYFNPADIDCPVPFNPFHVDEGEQVHLKAQETFTIFERAMPELSGARMRPLLTNTIHALTELPNTTILDVERLLDPYDPTLRDHIIETTTDPRTRRFWQEQYPRFPKDAHLPLINRFEDFLRPPVSTVLAHPTATLNVRDALDNGKLLFFNLSTGTLGERASQVLGQLLISKIQQAIATRDDMPEEKRRPFYFYIDEFQTYTSTATASYADILAKARKYKLALYLAHQQTQQIPRELLGDILGNVATTMVLNVSATDARKLSKDLLVNDPTELQQLEAGEAFVRLDNATYQIHTPLVDRSPDMDIQRRAIERSRANYGAVPSLMSTDDEAETQSVDEVPTDEDFLE